MTDEQRVAAYIATKMTEIAVSIGPKLQEVRNKYLEEAARFPDETTLAFLVDGVMLDTALILIDPAFRRVWANEENPE